VSWTFYDFYDRFNEWVEADDPPGDFRFWVMAWLYRVQEDPRADATPADAIGSDWWFVRVPRADNETHAVVCTYSIQGERVRCGGFTTLRKPIR
jgi:hypothetical protein